MNNSFMPGINNFNFPLPQFGVNMGNPNVIYESLSGFQAVKDFQIPPGKVGLLFDNNKQEFYWKDIDSHGMQTLKRFRYEEIPLKKSGKDMSATDWGRMADFYFTADDEDGSRLVDYYFQKMRNKMKKVI